MKQGRWAIAAVSVVLGVMLAVQYRSTLGIEENNINLQRAGDLAIQLEEVKKEKGHLEELLKKMREQGTVDTVKEENLKLRFNAGLTQVKGPGVIVTIDDSNVPIQKGENANLYLIHDEDILRVVNELRAGGAEALSINEQRLIGTSEIRCSGPTITVNGKIFTPPYVIKAVGDKKMLTAALNMRGGVVETLKHWGIQISIEQMQQIIIPPYTGVFRSEFGVSEEVQK